MIENKPRFRNENPNSETDNKRVVGVAYIGSWAGVNDNGEARVQGATVSVNRPLQAPNWKHCSRIMGKKYTLIEEEDMDAHIDNGQMVSYQKLIDGKQTDIDSPSHTYEPRSTTQYGTEDDDEESPSQNGRMGRLEILKNLVDTNQAGVVADREICNDRHENTAKRVSMVTVLATCGAVALLITVISLFM